MATIVVPKCCEMHECPILESCVAALNKRPMSETGRVLSEPAVKLKRRCFSDEQRTGDFAEALGKDNRF